MLRRNISKFETLYFLTVAVPFEISSFLSRVLHVYDSCRLRTRGRFFGKTLVILPMYVCCSFLYQQLDEVIFIAISGPDRPTRNLILSPA